MDPLTITFIVLKLCEVIDWSWWWVLAPTWMPLALILSLGVGAVLVAGTAKLFKSIMGVIH